MQVKIRKSDVEWRKELSPGQYHVLREKGTDRPFTGKYYRNHEKGTYRCAACGNTLFSSESKYDSGSGWPSFWAPVSPEAVETDEDRSILPPRVELLCARCGSHLGHVFDDGPPPTGKRYCINSTSLEFDKTG